MREMSQLGERRVTVHTSEMKLRHPRQFVAGIFKDIVRSRHIAWEMMKRDLKSQYRTSVLGALLPLLPALTTASWAILFQNAHIINVGAVNMPYPFFVLTGLMLWAAFLEAMDAPISGVQSEQQLLSKANVPVEAITIAKIGQIFVNFGVKSLILIVIGIIYKVHVPWTLLVAPIGLTLLIMMGAAIGLILAPINLLYTDIAKAIPMFTTVLFFSTPIIYLAPRKGWAAVLMTKINPVTPLLTTTRDLIFGNGILMPHALELSILFTLCLLFFALIFHRVAMPIVIDRSNA
jgi:lipopolysaccharide transport system permease protein